MNGILITIIAIGIAALIWFVIWPWYKRWNKTHRIWDALDRESGIPRKNAYFKHDYTTPQGVRVRSIVEVPSFVLTHIDTGIQNQITRHNGAYPHWDKFKNLSDYQVLFVEPTATNVETEPGSPAIHDSGIQTAGTCIGTVPLSSCRPELYIVLPHQKNHGAWSFTDYLMRSAWHESEHIREWANDEKVFAMYVGAGDVHPHVL